ncbi:MAG TPA: ABC transporter ATP-binding protein, partial [Planctomycetaceae bacterium]|nr:ABC transporter ATP-binding protein [Planctomycetaceae bacterium]
FMNDTSATSPPVAIDVERLSHSFGTQIALRNVNFRVLAGSLHGFVGPNGAGKTTTLKVVCTLLRPQRGRVTVFGNDVVAEARAVRRRIGYMPDHFSMYRQMTVAEYLDFFGAAYGLKLAERDRVLADVLALTDMEGRRDHLISTLSRGMQQRVSLARVLVNDPDLLLLDEPASGLDPRARIELMEILRELRRMGKTIFISSHILSELAELCDSVTIIDRGAVKYSGSMDELGIAADGKPVFTLRVATPADGLDERLRGLAGVTEVTLAEDRPEYRITIDSAVTDGNGLLRGILDLDVRIAGFAEHRKHLGQAFMDLTEQGVR